MSSELQNNFSRLALSSNQHQRIPSTSTLPSFLYEQQQADSRHFGSLIVVSNRLPVSLEQPVSELKGGEKPSFKQSSGGLVTALTGMKRKFKWLGWLGNEISDASVQESVNTELKSKYNCYPVFLDQKEADDYYNGFSNGILWPLFHYLFSEKNTVFNEKQWEAYKKVNEDFAKAILDIYQEGDLVWVHDYHLMLVPSLLRKARPNIYISFFLHIPFPSSEIYRMLPVRSELLEGVLACNLIGFHTHNFARHFLSSCTRILGAETSPKGLIHNGLSVNVQVFPIGINPRQFTDCVQTKETQERITYFREKYKDKKVILGIDRLDYTKGIELKLKAFEKFLASYPEHKKNTILLQVGVPTREAVKEYQDLISTTNQLVGKINSTHGTLDGFPVHYINKSVNFTDLCALYSIADALVVTSVRDGMNLVSCEYVVCQEASGGNGVLMLSEFAGAAASLGGSIILNPFDVELTAKAFAQAIEMDKEEKRVRHKQNYSIVSKNTAEKWGTDFITMFENACCEQANTVKLPKLSHSLLKSSYLKAQGSKRIFLLGYDGTLVPIKKYPALVFPPSKTLTALKQLAADPNNIVYILSARDRTSLEAIFNTIPQLGLAAEHGIFVRHPNSTTWTTLYHVEDFSLEWMRLISPILEHVEARTPGSFFEQKECSMAFHYRNAEAEYGEWQAKELALHLDLSFSSLPVEVLHGNKVLEIRPQGVSKGFAAQKILEKNLKDLKFVFCAGDDRSDEDMFNDTKCFFSHTVSPSASPQFKAILSRDSEFVDISSRRLSVDVTNMEDEAIQTRRYPGGLTVCTCLVGKTTGSKALCYLPSTTDLVEALDQMCK